MLSEKLCVAVLYVTPAGRVPMTAVKVAPSSTSLALANASSVLALPFSVAVPDTTPLTTGASFVPVTMIVVVVDEVAPCSSCIT